MASVVVIGSGMAGLYAAALLAKSGCKVTVLEKEPQTGGLLASFSRFGADFDTGLHYLGSLEPGQALWHYFQALDLFSLCRFEPLDREGFEEHRFGQDVFLTPWGHEAWAESLEAHFPGEREGIRACLSDWHELAERFPLYNLRAQMRPGREQDLLADPLARMPLADYLKSRIKNQRLAALLCANNVLYGIGPEECPVYIHALILDSFLAGAWRVAGPSRQLSRALVTRIEAYGGRVVTRSEVRNLSMRNGRIQAAVLADGGVWPADWFIAAIHPKQVLRLLDERAVRPIYRRRVNSLDETNSAFGLSVRLAGAGIKVPRRNFFLHQDHDMQKPFRESWQPDPGRKQPQERAPHTVFISPAEDADGRVRKLSVMCPMRWDLWSAWEDSRPDSRPAAYLAQKEQVAGALRFRLEEFWPGLGEQTAYWEAATPLTYRDYTGSWQGSAYGIKKSSQRLREATLSVRTHSDNLLLAGQSVVLPGIVGATISAAAAAGTIMGFPKMLSLLVKN